MLKENQIMVSTDDIEFDPKNVKIHEDADVNAIKETIGLVGKFTDPLYVVETEDGYRLIAGEGRLRAARELGFKEVPCYVWQKDTDAKTLTAIALAHNHVSSIAKIDDARLQECLIEIGEEVALKIGYDDYDELTKTQLFDESYYNEDVKPVEEDGSYDQPIREESQFKNILIHTDSFEEIFLYLTSVMNQEKCTVTDALLKIVREHRSS